MIKNISLILLGIFIGLAITFVIKIHSFQKAAHSIDSPFANHYFKDSSEEEMKTFFKIKEFYEQGNVDKLNEIIKIEKNEIKLIINGPKSFPANHSPVAEVVLMNISDHDLILFDPLLSRLTQESYDHKGYIQDDYSLSCSVNGSRQCHLLKSGEKISVPVLFNVSGIGTHKINVSFGSIIYEEITGNSVKSSSPTIDRGSYIFDIVKI